MDNLKLASIMGIANSLEKNQIISANSPLVEKVASELLEVDFDPTNPQDLQKVAVAFITMLDKEAAAVNRPDNTLAGSDSFSSLVEKIRTERNNVNKGVRGVGQSDIDNVGVVGSLLGATRKSTLGKDVTLDNSDSFSSLLEKLRAERNGVNKGRWGVGQSSVATQNNVGEEKRASSVDLDSLIQYLQE